MQQSIINLIVCYCGYDIRVTDTIDCCAQMSRSAFYLPILLAFLIDSIKYIDNERQQHQPLRGQVNGLKRASQDCILFS